MHSTFSNLTKRFFFHNLTSSVAYNTQLIFIARDCCCYCRAHYRIIAHYTCIHD